MTEYDVKLRTPVVFRPLTIKNTFGEILSRQGFRQMRVAETEKYAHVTYFFNGLHERAQPKEKRILVPSPKVATYDLKPEMSAHTVATELCRQIESRKYQFILANFANPDMVGHTGDLAATVQAVETVDDCLGSVVQSCLSVGCRLIVTADHGKAECLIDQKSGEPHTAHTLNPVPFIPVMEEVELNEGMKGGLSDVAPTILQLFDLEIPHQMSGMQLLRIAAHADP